MTTTSSHQELTKTVARWIVDAQTAELPAAVDHHVRRLLVDYFAGVIPGSVTDVSRAVATHVERNYGGDEATAIGLGRVSALGAAFMNGSAAHGLEVDDGYTPGSVHPSSVSFPSVLAAAEASSATRELTLRALSVALELTCRLAAAGHPATWRNHFHNTPISGVMGGAAGVAVILGLDETQVRDALGIAASHAGGLFAFLNQSAEVKRVHSGKASRDAVASAELALLGVTGPRSVFEGVHGYIDAFARGEFARGTLVDGLGDTWVMLNTYVKPYPSCRHLHAPIDGVLAMRTKHGFTSDQIAEVVVRTHTVASHHGNQNVESFLDAQMSIPYAVAVAAKYGEVGLDEFYEHNRTDVEVNRITRLTSVVADAACDADYPRLRPAIVTITLADGRKIETRIDQPYGEPSNPVTDEDMTAKFLRLAGPLLGDDAERVADELWEFASLDILTDIQSLLESRP